MSYQSLGADRDLRRARGGPVPVWAADTHGVLDADLLGSLFTVSLAGLSTRQRHLLGSVGRTDSLGEAALEMGVTPPALRSRLGSIASRLGLAGVGALVALARRRQTLEASSEAVCGSDVLGRCTFASRRYAEILGYTVEELVGQDLHAVLHEPARAAGVAAPAGCVLRDVLDGRSPLRKDAELLMRRDGSAVWVGLSAEAIRVGDTIVGAVIEMVDHSAMDDLHAQVEQARTHVRLALEASDSVAFEVDLVSGRFTTTGAAGGSTSWSDLEALVVAEQRGRVSLGALRALPPGVLVEEDLRLSGPDGAVRRYRARMRLLSDGLGQPRSVVGVARDVTVAEEADTAAVADLRRWLAEQRLAVHYQPIVAMDGTPAGVEALLRVEHPAGGLVLPGQVIPAAEQAALTGEVAAAVLSDACRQVAAWNRARQTAGSNPLWVSVNVSASDLLDDRICALVAGALADSGLRPPCLVLELTESAPIADWPAAERVVRDLRDMGVGLAVDDFGTGYASLESLLRLAVTALKLDRSIVEGVGRSERADVLAASVIALADRLGIAAVAEGIETGLQASRLQALGWELAQGHLWSPARPGPELEPLLLGGVPLTAGESIGRR